MADQRSVYCEPEQSWCFATAQASFLLGFFACTSAVVAELVAEKKRYTRRGCAGGGGGGGQRLLCRFLAH